MVNEVAMPISGVRPAGRFPLLAVAAVALVGLIVGAFWLGSSRPAVSFHTGVAHSAEGAISVEADGWTYAVPLDGVAWVDSRDTWHNGGRPECLPPTGTTRPITFAAVEATVEGSTWRPVVWVSCR